jgi:hypothetical protein
MEMFHIEPEMTTLLHDMSDEDIRAFVELQEDAASNAQIELLIYACFLISRRTASMGYLKRAIQRAEKWIAVTPNDHPQRLRRSEILDTMSARMCLVEKYQQFDIAGAMNRVMLGTGDIEDLNCAVEVTDMVVEDTPLDHPDRAGMLNNLGH